MIFTIMPSPIGKLLLVKSSKGLNHIIFEHKIQQYETANSIMRILSHLMFVLLELPRLQEFSVQLYVHSTSTHAYTMRVTFGEQIQF